MANLRAGILGTGHSYPEGILTNADLASMVETSDEWITTRTGIKQRRKAAPGEYTSMFAVKAGRQAIERAKIDPMEIDLSSLQIHVPGLQDLDALVGHVPVEAGNRLVQCLPDVLFGEGLGDDPRTELLGFEAGFEKGEEGLQKVVPGLVEMAKVGTPRHSTNRLDSRIP